MASLLQFLAFLAGLSTCLIIWVIAGSSIPEIMIDSAFYRFFAVGGLILLAPCAGMFVWVVGGDYLDNWIKSKAQEEERQKDRKAREEELQKSLKAIAEEAKRQKIEEQPRISASLINIVSDSKNLASQLSESVEEAEN